MPDQAWFQDLKDSAFIISDSHRAQTHLAWT